MPTSCTCACGHTGGAYRRPCSEPGGCRTIGCDGYGTIHDQQDTPAACLLCQRRMTRADRVCPKCMDRVWGWLKSLPDLWQRLELELMPGAAAGERVRSSSPGSRPAANVAALSLRHRSARTALPVWKRRPDWTPDGADLSIPEWVEGWVWAWRRRHEHHRPSLVDAHPTATPERATPPVPPGEAPPRPDLYTERGDLLPPDVIRHRLEVYIADLAVWRARADAYTAEFAAWKPAADETAREGARIVLGLGPAQPPTGRPDDPLSEQVAHRLGDRAQAFSLGANTGYLANWFDYACDHPDQHPDLDAFIAGLRELVGAASAAVGERSGLVYLGRCPEPFHDKVTGTEEPCGAHLLSDPTDSSGLVVCRRCKSEWAKEKWLFLCARIREVWPDSAPDRRTWEAAS